MSKAISIMKRMRFGRSLCGCNQMLERMVSIRAAVRSHCPKGRFPFRAGARGALEGSGPSTGSGSAQGPHVCWIMKDVFAYTYILECANGQYYVGSTIDLERRVMEHQAGLGGCFTRRHLPVRLVYYEKYSSVEQAFAHERQLHGWSRAKKEALIHGEVERLAGLSAGRKVGPSTGSGTVL